MNKDEFIINYICNVNNNLNYIIKKSNLTKKQFIKKIFSYLYYFIDISTEEKNYDYIINKLIICLDNLFKNEELNLEEIKINIQRINKINELIHKKNKKDLNKYYDKLNSISIIKNNINALEQLIITLINNNEDYHIIKKLIKIDNYVLENNNCHLFDYVFNKYKLETNKTNQLYYLYLLKILYTPKIKKSKYNIDNIEIKHLLKGNKYYLGIDELKNKYSIQDINNSNVQIHKNKIYYMPNKIITIDELNTELRDDGISIKKDGNIFIIGIHIADGGNFIIPNSINDIIAKNNFKCIYPLKKMGFRMFNQNIESKLSLNENKIRAVLSLYIFINNNGKIYDYYFDKEYINIKKNLFNTDCQKILECKNELYNEIKYLYEIANKLEQNNLHIKEYWNKKDANKKIKNETTIGDIITREFILLYNSLVGDIAYNSDIPFIYRIQDKEYLTTIIKEKKLNLNLTAQEIIKNTYLRTKYSSIPTGHDGLGKKIYTQCSNPIRRYPDLYNQYFLHKYYFKDKNYNLEEINKLIEYLNNRSLEISLFETEYKKTLKK